MTGRLADHGAASPGPDRFGPSLLSRILSGLAGAAILCLTALFTLGTALAAPIGVLVGEWRARRGGRSLTRSGSWWAAIIACTAAITCAFAISAALAPPGTFRRVQPAAATGPTPPVSQPPT